MMPSSRHIPILPLGLSLLMTLLAACGGPTAQHKKASSLDDSRPAAIRDRDLAETTRKETIERRKDWDLTSDKVREVAPIVRRAADEYGLAEDLIFGIIWVESRFDPEAKSSVGAQGLMQLMPRTAAYLAECIKWKGRGDPNDPEFNITAGSYYIATLIQRFDGNEDLALAAYNAGPTKIRRWLSSGGLPQVSVEYHTMVQTARSFFKASVRPVVGDDIFVPSTEELDRLGLAILIAGLSETGFGLERIDSGNPFQ